MRTLTTILITLAAALPSARANTPADGFGGLPRNDAAAPALLKLLDLPRNKQTHWQLIGIKAWPALAGHYVLTACATDRPLFYPLDRQKSHYADCGSVEDITVIALALLRRENGRYVPAARPWVERVRNHTASPALMLKNHSGETVLGRPEHLDFAPYRLKDGLPAFGLRFYTREAFAGGGAYTQSMSLFAVIDGRLRPVLTVPMTETAMLAGKWHADGTRDHHESEKQYVLIVSDKQSNGFKQLIWKNKNAKKPERTYHWHPSKQSYGYR